jgi:steroid Delta-isomerase
MTIEHADFQAALDNYAQVFAALTPQNLHSTLPNVFAPQAKFKDPFNEVIGLDNIMGIFEHMYATLDAPHFVITHTAQKGLVGYIHWTFHFHLKGQTQPQTLEGLSRIVFNEQRQVTEHIDYWDAGAAIYAKIPVLGWGVRWVAKKLSAQQG